MPMALVTKESKVCRLGPGLRVALATLGEPGLAIAAHWRRLDDQGAWELEFEAWATELPGAGLFDESRGGTRWRAYGHTGEAVALLRRAARAARHCCEEAVPQRGGRRKLARG